MKSLCPPNSARKRARKGSPNQDSQKREYASPHSACNRARKKQLNPRFGKRDCTSSIRRASRVRGRFWPGTARQRPCALWPVGWAKQMGDQCMARGPMPGTRMHASKHGRGARRPVLPSKLVLALSRPQSKEGGQAIQKSIQKPKVSVFEK